MNPFRELFKSIKAALLVGRRFERTIDEVVNLGHKVDRTSASDSRRMIGLLATLDAMSSELRRIGHDQGEAMDACERMQATLEGFAKPLGELGAKQGQMLTSVEAMATEVRYCGPRHQVLMDAIRGNAEMIKQAMTELAAMRDAPTEIVRQLRDGSERLQALAREARELSVGFRVGSDRRGGHSEVLQGLGVAERIQRDGAGSRGK